jgi:hypothetical protein
MPDKKDDHIPEPYLEWEVKLVDSYGRSSNIDRNTFDRDKLYGRFPNHDIHHVTVTIKMSMRGFTPAPLGTLTMQPEEYLIFDRLLALGCRIDEVHHRSLPDIFKPEPRYWSLRVDRQADEEQARADAEEETKEEG